MFTTKVNFSELTGKAVIYAFRLIGTNRVYVGQTTNAFRRFRGHIYAPRYEKHRKYCPKFYAAVLQYGHAAFEFTILAICDVGNLDALERTFIDELKAEELGFNISRTCHKSFLGKKHTEETKEKMRKAATGRKMSAYTQAQLIKVHKGSVHSAEHRKKISIGNKGKRNKPVVKCDLEGNMIKIYPSITDAILDMGRPPSCAGNITLVA